MIKCFRIYDNTTEEVAMSNCQTENQTLPTQACNLRPCGFLEWGAGYWSKVSEISLVMRINVFEVAIKFNPYLANMLSA